MKPPEFSAGIAKLTLGKLSECGIIVQQPFNFIFYFNQPPAAGIDKEWRVEVQ